jgi:hypothetical protein
VPLVVQEAHGLSHCLATPAVQCQQLLHCALNSELLQPKAAQQLPYAGSSSRATAAAVTQGCTQAHVVLTGKSQASVSEVLLQIWVGKCSTGDRRHACSMCQGHMQLPGQHVRPAAATCGDPAAAVLRYSPP